jgi:toxin ParE1/3/4
VVRESTAGIRSEFTLRFDALVERIAQNPLQFPEIGSGVRRALLRRFPYAIYFVATGSPIIIAVLHQRRYPAEWKQRL